MLEALDLTRSLSREEYKRELPLLQRRLHRLQRACWEGNVGTVVVLEGWDASGKGQVIQKLTQRLEPRRFSLCVVREPRTREALLPWMWRFWADVPNWGEVAIFDRGWYSHIVGERVEKQLEDEPWHAAATDIRSFERTLADDRYVVAKFFLHITKAEQKRRLKAFEEDPKWGWRLDNEDWKHHGRYDEYRVAFEEMLEQTESEWAPWTLVEAMDHRWARCTVFQTLIRRMEEGLARFGLEVPAEEPPPVRHLEDDSENGVEGC